MLAIYSNAAVHNSYFDGNEAADNGGALFIKIRSKMKLTDSIFKLNEAQNSGGSIAIQHSHGIFQSCEFTKESAVFGSGGAISAENVANVTVLDSSFDNCTAFYGGSMSVTSESVLVIENLYVTNSFAFNNGGSIYIFQHSFLNGYNLTVADGKSITGSGIYVYDSSGLSLKIFNFNRNTVNESGGAIYCRKGQIQLEEGIFQENCAKLKGGGVFGHSCDVVFDHNNFVNNVGLVNGGGIFFVKSKVEIHNSEGINNTAENIYNFVVITRNSQLLSNYLHLPKAQGNCIVIVYNSEAVMQHTYLLDLNDYCPIVTEMGIKITVQSIYFTNKEYAYNLQNDSTIDDNAVCADNSSHILGITKGTSVSSFVKK